MYFIKSNTNGTYRVETLHGKKYYAIPVVALKEQVLKCSTCPNPEFVSSASFHPAAAWNGRPVTLDHPHLDDGMMVSANSPQMLEKFAVGFMFNTTVEGDVLKTEAWLEADRLAALGDKGKSLLERLNKNEPVEVSTGYFSDIRDVEGTHNGTKYKGVQLNIKPDHIAILNAGDKGACSWEDGCGIRANSRDDASFRANCSCNEGTIDVAAMETYLKGKYGNVEYADTKNDKYPIDTVEHIKAAWDYINVAKNAAEYSSSELATIKRRIIAAWKAKINPEGPPSAAGSPRSTDNEGDESFAARVLQLLAGHSPKVLLRLLNSTDVTTIEDNTMETPEQKAAREAKERENARRTELVAKIKAHKGNKQTEEQLIALPIANLEMMNDLLEPEPKATPAQRAADEAGNAGGATSNEGKPKPGSIEAFMADNNTPQELKDLLREKTQKDKDRKTFLIGKLKANKSNKLSETQLNASTLDILEALYTMIEPVSFAGGQGTRRENIGEVHEEGNDGVFTPVTIKATEMIQNRARHSPRMARYVPAAAQRDNEDAA